MRVMSWDADSIKQLRLRKRLYQREFADLFGVSEQTVREWESGRQVPDLKNQEKLDEIGRALIAE